MKCPYNFTARSRSAMAAEIEQIGHQRGYGGERFPFCFNVKLDCGWQSNAADLSKASGGDYTLRPEWDSEWESYAESNGENLFHRVSEDMWRSMVEDYSTYPGDDSGEWGFTLQGRCGGWLCLISGPGFDFRNRYLDDIISEVRGDDPLERFTWAECKRLYRALVCMDRDFSRDAIRRELQYQLAFIRAEWEQEREESIRRAWQESREAREEARQLLANMRKYGQAVPPLIRKVTCEHIGARLRFGRQSRAAMWDWLGEVEPGAIITEVTSK